MAQRVVLSSKQKHTTNSGVEEESVLKECCKSSLKSRTSLFEKPQNLKTQIDSLERLPPLSCTKLSKLISTRP